MVGAAVYGVGKDRERHVWMCGTRVGHVSFAVLTSPGTLHNVVGMRRGATTGGRGKERAEGTGSGGCDELADENRGCGWIWEPEGVVRRVRREGESSEEQKKSGQ